MSTKNFLVGFLLSLSMVAHAACPMCGEWALDRPDGSGGYLVISQAGGKTVFKLEVSSAGDTPNQGVAEGTLIFKAGVARYRALEPICKIDFRYAAAAMVVTSHRTESFECGFASGVVADGKYVRGAPQNSEKIVR